MRKESKFASIMGRVILALLVFMTLLPFYLLAVNSFKAETDVVKHPFMIPIDWQFANYAKAFPQVMQPMINSLVVTVAVVVLTILFSILAAYAFARFKFFLKEPLYFGVIAMLMIPGFVLLIPQFLQVVKLGLYDTYWALIMVPTAYQVAMGTFLIRTSIEGIPSSLFEAATLAGANDAQILHYVVLPMSKPILATVTIMTGLGTWNNYIWPLVATSSDHTRQVAVALTNLVVDMVQGKGMLFAGYVCASLPIIILFCCASKSFIEGLSQGAVKG